MGCLPLRYSVPPVRWRWWFCAADGGFAPRAAHAYNAHTAAGYAATAVDCAASAVHPEVQSLEKERGGWRWHSERKDRNRRFWKRRAEGIESMQYWQRWENTQEYKNPVNPVGTRAEACCCSVCTNTNTYTHNTASICTITWLITCISAGLYLIPIWTAYAVFPTTVIIWMSLNLESAPGFIQKYQPLNNLPLRSNSCIKGNTCVFSNYYIKYGVIQYAIKNVSLLMDSEHTAEMNKDIT